MKRDRRRRQGALQPRRGAAGRLAPDLIVTQAVCEVCAVSYEDVVEVAARLPGPPRVLQQDPSSLAEVLADLTRLGAAAGLGPAAAVRAGLEDAWRRCAPRSRARHARG